MMQLDDRWLDKHPLPTLDMDTDKNSRGRIVVVGGSRFVPGALRLTGEAALRAGAGKLQLGTVGEAALLLGMFVPEAGVFELATDPSGEIEATAVADVLTHARSCDAVVVGPGMTSSEGCSDLVRGIIEGVPAEVAIVLDAAGIAACRSCRDVIRVRAGPVVITPHHGEMAALTGSDIAEVAREPMIMAREVAADLNAVVVLKAADTVIAAPGEDCLIFMGGTPGLATGGSGDVLAGALGGLLARQIEPFLAAAWAVWAHGSAGQALTARLGGPGLLGRELLDIIPRALARQL